MRYRREDTEGDYTLVVAMIRLINSPEAVAQAVKHDLHCGTGSGSSIRQREHRGFSLCSVSKSRKPTIWRSASASSKRGA